MGGGTRARNERFLREAKERDPALEPTEKRCAACHTVKPVADFGTVKSKTISGLISVAPRSNCNECEARRSREFKARKIEDGTWDDYVARKEANRDEAKRREYHREYGALRRRREGAKPMNRREPRRLSEPRRIREVPPEPASVLLEVLEADGYSRSEISNRSGVEVRRLYDIRYVRTASTSIDNVDKILIAFNRLDELEELYPIEGLDEEERLVGYAILDPEGVLESA